MVNDGTLTCVGYLVSQNVGHTFCVDFSSSANIGSGMVSTLDHFVKLNIVQSMRVNERMRLSWLFFHLLWLTFSLRNFFLWFSLRLLLFGLHFSFLFGFLLCSFALFLWLWLFIFLWLLALLFRFCLFLGLINLLLFGILLWCLLFRLFIIRIFSRFFLGLLC